MTSVTFGKYKGKTVEELISSDRRYLEWLVNQEFFREYHIYEKVKTLLGTVSSSTSSLAVMPGNEAGVVSFGKYKGLPLSTLFADTGYCKWLVEQEFFKRNSLYGEVKVLVGGGGGGGSSSSVYESGGSGIAVAGDDGAVSFGKYKGQPLSVLFADSGYCRWVVTQEWFAKNRLYARVKKIADGALGVVTAKPVVQSRAVTPEPDSPCSNQGDSDHGGYGSN